MKILFRQKTFVYFRRKKNLAFEYFISKKTLKSVVQGKKVSKPIVRISIISIALAVIVNVITIAVVTGFQQEVSQEISGFGAHVFIMGAGDNTVYESEAIRIEQPFISSLKKDPEIRSIYPVGYKPVLFQSDNTEVNYSLANGKDTTEFHQNVFGAIIKGVNEDFDWDFFKEHLIEGIIPDYQNKEKSNHIIISQTLATSLQFSLNDTVKAFFVKNQPVRRNFVIAGIYSTGLEEFDEKIVLGKLSHVQELNDWGVKASINVADTTYDDQLIIRADVTGGNGNYKYDWGKGFQDFSGFLICPYKDTTVRLITADFDLSGINGEEEANIPDTAYLKIEVKGSEFGRCEFKLTDIDEIERTYLNDDGSKFSVTTNSGSTLANYNGNEFLIAPSSKTITFEKIDGKGSSQNYVGGFEIMLKNVENLDAAYKRIKKKIDFIPNKFDELLMTTSIKDNQREIFIWLDFLDINVVIILTLMILIGIINMGSALLVLILIRSNFIGMMKAMGATNWSIRKIFLYQATFLISRGMLYGNIVGLGICFIQSYFGIFTLNPEVYYLSEVPIELTFMHWLILNIATLFVCVLALIIPSIVITRISPVKAIKFD